MSKSLFEMVAEKRTEQMKPANDLIARAEAEGRDLTETEFAEVRTVAAANTVIDARLADLAKIAEGNAVAARTAPVYGGAVVRSEKQTYTAQGDYSHVRDVIGATMRNDQTAWERVRRHSAEVRVEQRDISRTLGMANSCAKLAARQSRKSDASAKIRPPKCASSSHRITSAPARAAVSAAINPAGPEPTTNTSQNAKAFS